MNNLFLVAFERLIDHEGGYVNNIHDPGRETKFGISKRSYPNVDIKNLTLEAARDIYFRDYWTACGQMLSKPLHYQVFDAAVNHGIGNAIRMLQRAVGAADDGHWGPHSQSKYAAMTDSDAVLRFLAERLEFFSKLSTFSVFGPGWTMRIVKNMRYAAEDI